MLKAINNALKSLSTSTQCNILNSNSTFKFKRKIFHKFWNTSHLFVSVSMSGHVIKFEAKLFQLTTKKRVWTAGTWETPLLWWPEKVLTVNNNRSKVGANHIATRVKGRPNLKIIKLHFMNILLYLLPSKSSTCFIFFYNKPFSWYSI